MTTRRSFLQALAAMPPALALRKAWAADADPSRLALVIGNSAYRDAPLVNPGNDASAMADLFGQAGFTVDSRLNATRNDMMAAIERFGAAIRRPEIRQVVFYYAGHGVQLDWRNYLLPVDAEVTSADQVRQRCVDLNQLLLQLGAAKDKAFIIILDACQQPFRRLSRNRGPPDSMRRRRPITYATSPGTSSDGSENCLHRNLRELSQRSTRIEDALKRVRLNVRLASRNAQIPWETTSLESDVFIFKESQKKLSEEDLEKELETDIAEWGRIKSSKNAEDWVGYLRKFPNGRFTEIAQTRLARLTAAASALHLWRQRRRAYLRSGPKPNTMPCRRGQPTSTRKAT
jgi:uncharacterized caspase-like protein